VSHVIRIGEAATPSDVRPLPSDLDAVDENEVRCFDPESSAAMVLEIKAAAKVGDSLGGIVEVIAYGVPVDSAATCTGIANSTDYSPAHS